MEQTKPEYEGIGGWMLFSMIGMIASHALMLRNLFENQIPMLLDGYNRKSRIAYANNG